jgi:uncharacterized protein YndB with AHSA1/START domain
MNVSDEPLAGIDAAGTIRFERKFAAPIAEVWRRISTGDGLASWFAPAEIDLRTGGSVVIHFDEENKMNGTILACDPPHTLEYTWKETNSDVTSRVRYELVERGKETLMTFTHTGTKPADRSGFGAGWHAGFHGLALVLAGQSDEGDTTYTDIFPEYVALFGDGEKAS